MVNRIPTDMIEDRTSGRKLSEQLADIAINVKNFGAVGDGVTDDTTSIQNAISALTKTKSLFIPDGVYIVNGLLADGVKVTGTGTLKWKSGVSGNTPLLTLKNGASVNGVTFDGNKANNTFSGNTQAGLSLISSPFTVIDGCIFQNFPATIMQTDVTNSPNGLITNCVFKNSNKYGCIIRSSGWTVIGNKFIGTGIQDGHAVRFGVWGTDDQSVVVNNQRVVGNLFKFINSTGVLCEVGSQNTIVEGNTFDSMSGVIKCEYVPESNVKNVIFTGNYIQNTKFIGSYNETTETWTESATANTASSFKTDGMIVSNNEFFHAPGINVGGNAIIQGNRFSDCGSTSIPTIEATDSAYIRDNYIINSTYYGIYMNAGSDNSDVTHNTIINLSTQTGIRLASSNLNVNNNRIVNGVKGIDIISGLTGLRVENNRITGSTTSLSNSSLNGLNYVGNNVGADDSSPVITIVSDSVTVSPLWKDFRADTEASASTDDLSTITGGRVGQILTIRSYSNVRDVTVRDNLGNLKLAGDFVLDTNEDTITLLFNGTNWLEIARSNNT